MWPEKSGELRVASPGNRRVLLVDDEPANLSVLAAVLDDHCDVATAGSGAEAQRILAESGPVAAIIADQRMPGMTGVELLSDVARRSPESVRIVLTAYSDLDPIVAAVNQGSVYRFFLKPWDAEEMRFAVDDAIWLYEARVGLRSVVHLQGQRRDELARTLDRLKRSQADLLAAERMATLGRFTSGMTQNIRNNLTLMSNLLEAVQQIPGESAVLRSAQTAFRSLGALLRLVSDVNALAKGENHSAGRSIVEMLRFLDQTLDLFRLETAGKGREVRIMVDDRSRVLRFDPAGVRQVILALLRNAAEASETTSAIVVSVTTDERWQTYLEVRDRGCGLPAEVVQQAGRLPGGRRPTGPFALGIGLEICRMVAQAHGGGLRVSSNDQGATVGVVMQNTDPSGEES